MLVSLGPCRGLSWLMSPTSGLSPCPLQGQDASAQTWREKLEWEPAERSRNLPARLDAAVATRPAQPGPGIPAGRLQQLRSFPPLLPEPSPAGCPEQPSISCSERWGPAGVLAGGEELALGVGRRDGAEEGARNKCEQPVGLSGETGAQAERCRACGERRGTQRDVGLVSGARAPVDVRVLLVSTCKRGDLCEKRVRSVRWVRGARCIQRLLQACCASRPRSSRGGCGDCHELIRRILFYNRCHSNGEAGSSLPPDPSASSAARPAKLRDHLLIRATGWSPPRCRCPSPGLRPPCGEGRQPPGTGSRARIQHLGEGWRG